jgi:hypothetical protein
MGIPKQIHEWPIEFSSLDGDDYVPASKGGVTGKIKRSNMGSSSTATTGHNGLEFIFDTEITQHPGANNQIRFNNADAGQTNEIFMGRNDANMVGLGSITNNLKNTILYFTSDNPDFYAAFECSDTEDLYYSEGLFVTSIGHSTVQLADRSKIYFNIYPLKPFIPSIEIPPSADPMPDLTASTIFTFTPDQDFTLMLPNNFQSGSRFQVRIYGGHTMSLDAGYKVSASGFTRSTDTAKYDVFNFVCFDYSSITLMNVSIGYQ